MVQDTFSQSLPYCVDAHAHTRVSDFTALAAWKEGAFGENDPLRVLHFVRLLDEVRELGGDYVEMGTRYGESARLIFELMNPRRRLYCFDTFTGFAQEDLDIEARIRPTGFTTDSIRGQSPEEVRKTIAGDRPDDRLILVPGHIPGSLAPFNHLSLCFAHLDLDLYEPTKQAIEWVWPRLRPGGIVLFHDFDALPTVRRAAEEYLGRRGVSAVPLSDRFGSAAAIKGWSRRPRVMAFANRVAARLRRSLQL